ncbi:hypothetical protein K9B35_16480 [Sphingomonas sp. R647]|nr:hypothetical protein [Sphingomonas sp. R647]
MPRSHSRSGARNTLSRGICVRAIAAHEYGHALGFSHEQNRADAP